MPTNTGVTARRSHQKGLGWPARIPLVYGGIGDEIRLATVHLVEVSCGEMEVLATSATLAQDGDLRVYDDQVSRAVAAAHVPHIVAMEDQLREPGGTSRQREDQDR